MKILYTLNSKNPGGMEQHVLDLVNGMVSSGHEVFVWCLDGKIADWYKDAGAKVTNHQIKFDVDPFYILKLTKFLRENKIDIIHAHELKAVTNSLLAGALAKTRIKVSHTHTPISEWQVPKIKKIPTIWVYSFIVNLLSDTEIALTESRKKVKIKEGIKEKKLAIIPNGLNVSKFNLSSSQKMDYKKQMAKKYAFSEKKFIFGVSSRITIEKGHKILINAFHRLLEYKDVSKADVHLLIAGGGMLEDELTNQLHHLNIYDSVTITKRFPSEDLVKLFASFDSFVFPTLAEGFGIVLIEAMAMGLPTICSNLEVLEEVGGSAVFSYFETGDFVNLSEKMYELYRKRDILDNIKESAVARVRSKFTLKKFIENYKDLYENINARKS